MDAGGCSAPRRVGNGSGRMLGVLCSEKSGRWFQMDAGGVLCSKKGGQWLGTYAGGCSALRRVDEWLGTDAGGALRRSQHCFPLHG